MQQVAIRVRKKSPIGRPWTATWPRPICWSSCSAPIRGRSPPGPICVLSNSKRRPHVLKRSAETSPCSTWRTPDIRLEEIADPAYKALLTGATACGFEEFRQQVLRELARSPPRPRRRRERVAP